MTSHAGRVKETIWKMSVCDADHGHYTQLLMNIACNGKCNTFKSKSEDSEIRNKQEKKQNRTMKTRTVRVCSLSITAGGLMLVSGCVMQPNGTLAFQPFIIAQPVVYAQPQAPVYEEPVAMVPETYVLVDGVNVGIVGGQYYVLSGGVWIIDREHYSYYHGWFRDHPTYWREHGIRNDLYRRDAHGHEKPMGDNRRDPSGHAGQYPKNDQNHPNQQQSHQPNIRPEQPNQQQPQTKTQPQQKPQPKKTTDKEQKPQ